MSDTATTTYVTAPNKVVSASNDVIAAVGKPEVTGEDYLGAFFTSSRQGRDAGTEVLGRLGSRTADRDEISNWQTRLAQ